MKNLRAKVISEFRGENRAERRRIAHGRLSGRVCMRCGIDWDMRFKMWSVCTVDAPPALIAPGHLWIKA